MVLTVLVFIAVLAVLVLAHEWGHFFAARRLGIAVKEFGFGFPPRLASTTWRGIVYSLNWLPLGGFVKLKGEDGGESGEADSFAAQKAWKRVVVLVAGVAMNVVVAWLLLSVTLGVGIRTALNDSELDQVSAVSVQVMGVTPKSPADEAGIKMGDVVLSLDGQAISRISALQSYFALQVGKSVAVAIDRSGAPVKLYVTPKVMPEAEGRAAIGVNLVHSGVLAYPWPQSFVQGGKDTWHLAREIVTAFGHLFSDLVSKGNVPQDISGPVGIAVMTGQVAEMGLVYLLQFMALLSLNLAIINILPFPALDGGRVFFVIIEKIIGRRVHARLESVTHTVGFALLMALIIAITYRDIARLSGGFFNALLGS